MKRANTSSWFPVRNFTKSSVNRDWMMGSTRFKKCKDAIDPSHDIREYETVFWNRSMNNATISLETYRKIQETKNPELLEKLREYELPIDIKV